MCSASSVTGIGPGDSHGLKKNKCCKNEKKHKNKECSQQQLNVGQQSTYTANNSVSTTQTTCRV